MANYYDLGTEETYVHGKDGVIIRNYLDGIKGGVVLDTTDFTDDYIQCGHVIIKSTSEDSYAPMPVSDGAYASLPDNYEYAGVATTNVPKGAPFTGVLTAGEVNDNAVPYSIDSIKTALIAALPNIRWEHDV